MEYSHKVRTSNSIVPFNFLYSIFSGYLLRCVQSGFGSVTHLILDEVHERELNTDLLQIFIRDAIEQYEQLKIILMSATMNASLFSQYFGGAEIINIPGRSFEVDVLYMEKVLTITHYSTDEIKKYIDNALDHGTKQFELAALENLTLLAYQSTINASKSNAIDHQLLEHLIWHIHTTANETESILVFLPGYQDIMSQKRHIEKIFCRNGVQNFRLFVLHSGVDVESTVFGQMPHGIRKILLSTNIAETSVTINDVVSWTLFCTYINISFT